MLFAIDVGNTNVKFGIHDGQQWTHVWRVQTVADRMADEYAAYFRQFFADSGLDIAQLKSSVVSSVVPKLTPGMIQIAERYVPRKPVVLQYGLNLGINIRTDFPNQVGADLIADAVAAYDHFKTNCIVVDFGTATKFIAVNAQGDFLGVAISAGLYATVDSLVSKAAKLPYVDLVPPPSVIGRNTVHSMQAGLVVGYVAMTEGLIDRVKAELGDAKVVATGGLVSLIAPLTDRFDVVDPYLTLEGLRLVAERNA